MEEKIFKLLIEYTLVGKIADQSFLNQLADIIVNEWNLENYFKGVNLKNIDCEKEFLHGEFDYNRRIADIYIAFDNLNLGKDKEERLKKIYYINIKIIQHLLKEIEHSKQLKNALSSRNDLEIRLIRDNLEYLGEIKMPYIPTKLPNFLKKFMYDKFYEFMPVERIATINSTKTALDIISKNETYPEIKSEIKHMSHKAKYAGYQVQDKQIIAPTPYFLESIGHEELLNNVNYTIFDKETRLKYGFPIGFSEYNNIEDSKKTL